MWKGVVEESCSPHGLGRRKTERKAVGVSYAFKTHLQ
jgi:hypothetical protein